MSRRRPRAPYSVRAVLLSGLAAALGSTLLAACGATPVASGPTGIDGLTIPTPSPTPADFVSRVDNPWFPLDPGTRWTYDLYSPAGSRVVTATVSTHPRAIVGVETTAVRWQLRSPGRPPRTLAVRWYAEDSAGNVWWFGQRVTPGGPQVDQLATRSWQAGRDGAEAGLQMAAAPRNGDGYANGYQARVMERHSTVASVDAAVALPQASYHHTVATQDLSPLDPIRQVRSFYARGIGLVAQQTSNTLTTDLTLTRIRRPQPQS